MTHPTSALNLRAFQVECQLALILFLVFFVVFFNLMEQESTNRHLKLHPVPLLLSTEVKVKLQLVTIQ